MKLEKFLVESNAIEGITGIRPEELEVAGLFLEHPRLDIADVAAYVSVTAPKAELRRHRGMDVRVGHYFPPRGGPAIAWEFDALLEEINNRAVDPWRAHVRYERLHPFTDGNGRSGRLIWLWHMRQLDIEPSGRLFLQSFYYQTLDSCGDV